MAKSRSARRVAIPAGGNILSGGVSRHPAFRVRHFVGILSLVGLLIGLATPGHGQEPKNDFFADRSVVRFTLKTDLSALLFDRSLDSEERDADLEYIGPDGESVLLPVEVKTRGKFRLIQPVCDFPLIRLNFRKRDVVWTMFEGQDKIKLVTHCRTPDEGYEQYVILEYLVYRLCELITPKSLRTRLAVITYDDISGTWGHVTRYAFLLEDVDEMAARNDAKIVKFDGFHALLADPFEMGVHDVFQYMIGHTDWSTVLNQNVEFIQDVDGNVAVVPFDFDWAGAVAPPYAKPAPDVPVETVQDRFYMGVCRMEDHLTPVFERFVELREQIYDLYRNEQALAPAWRDKILAYYDDFYETITDEALAEERIRKACRL